MRSWTPELRARLASLRLTPELVEVACTIQKRPSDILTTGGRR